MKGDKNGMNVLDEIRNRAKSLKKTIALPEYDDERVLQAAEIATRDQVAYIQLVGDPIIIKEKAKSFGIHDIVLDVGIGFGKNLEHNLTLIKKLNYFSLFGYELLIGASRKSMINMITPSEIENRLPGTLAIHLESLRYGASIIRCHDVKEHFQAIKVFEAIENIN